MAPDPVTIDVWSDVACPWCYIGKRRFEAGVEQYARTAGARPVTVEYHSFELVPDAPVEFDGTELDFLAGRFRTSREQAQQLVGQVTAIAASVGLAYDFDTVRHTNTRKAHEVL